MEYSVRQAREHFSQLLDQVISGAEVTISRRGKKLVLMTAIHTKETHKKLPSLKAFREKHACQGLSLSESIVESRDKERY